jgi:hypothetical protein
MLAAAANGYAATATFFPGALGPIPAEPKTELLARVELTPGIRQESELYNAIPRRHTNRAPYDRSKALAPDFLDVLGHLVDGEENVRIFLFTSEEERKKIADVSSVANTELYSDPDVERESEKWVHTRWSEVQKYRDGLSVDAFGLAPSDAAIAKMMPQWMLAWGASHSEKNGYLNLMMSAPLIGIIAVRDRNEREQCMRAGRIWQRAHLLATARGLAGRPCNEAVEMIDHERALGRAATRLAMLNAITGDATWQPTFVFYMGYPTITARMSPRRPVPAVVDGAA